MNIYVGNLPFAMSEDQLRAAFAAHGEVGQAKVITDRNTGQSRGFGFVEMVSESAGESAIKALNGSDFGGRRLVVNRARPRTIM